MSKLPVIHNISNVKKSNSWTMDKVHEKLDTRRLKHNVANFEVTIEGHPNYSKTCFMKICRYCDDHQMQPQN